MYCTGYFSFHNSLHRPPSFHGFIFWVKWITLQHLLLNLSRRVWIIFRSNFKTFFLRYMIYLYLSIQILLSNVFRNGQYMICNFGGWPQSYLTTPEAFWTSMSHCFRAAVQFSREICCGEKFVVARNLLRREICCGEKFVVARCLVLIFDICDVYEFALDWLYSHHWGRLWRW